MYFYLILGWCFARGSRFGFANMIFLCLLLAINIYVLLDFASCLVLAHICFFPTPTVLEGWQLVLNLDNCSFWGFHCLWPSQEYHASCALLLQSLKFNCVPRSFEIQLLPLSFEQLLNSSIQNLCKLLRLVPWYREVEASQNISWREFIQWSQFLNSESPSQWVASPGLVCVACLMLI